MERIVRGRSATLSHTFYSNGTATDPSPDSATVAVVRSDGTAVTTGSVDNTAAGVAAVTIPATSNTLLDTYTVTWTASFGGQAQTFVETVEVAGDVLFTVAEARAAGLTEADYPTASIVKVRTRVEQRIERALGVAFVPRYALETFTGDRGTTVIPRWPYARNVRSVTRDGVAVTPVSSALNVANGIFYLSSGWSYRYSTATIGYEHGHEQPEEPVRQEALRLARLELTSTPSSTDPRVASFTTDDGTVRYRDSGPGTVFAIDEQIVADYGMNIGIA